jgi:serine/threonine protein kinase
LIQLSDITSLSFIHTSKNQISPSKSLKLTSGGVFRLAGYPPFYHEREDVIKKLIARGQFEFYPEEWNEVSQQGWFIWFHSLLAQCRLISFCCDHILIFRDWMCFSLALFHFLHRVCAAKDVVAALLVVQPEKRATAEQALAMPWFTPSE